MFKIKIDASFAGQEWAGEYEVKMLYAPEDLVIYKEVAKEIKKKGIKPKLPNEMTPKEQKEIQNLLSWIVFKHSVRKDGEPLPQQVPIKIFDLLIPQVSKLNILSEKEGQDLFLPPTTDSQHKKKEN